MGHCYEFLNSTQGQAVSMQDWESNLYGIKFEKICVYLCSLIGSPTLANLCCILWRIHHDKEVLVPQGFLGSLR
jgi:hypothetical protein